MYDCAPEANLPSSPPPLLPSSPPSLLPSLPPEASSQKLFSFASMDEEEKPAHAAARQSSPARVTADPGALTRCEVDQQSRQHGAPPVPLMRALGQGASDTRRGRQELGSGSEVRELRLLFRGLLVEGEALVVAVRPVGAARRRVCARLLGVDLPQHHQAQHQQPALGRALLRRREVHAHLGRESTALACGGTRSKVKTSGSVLRAARPEKPKLSRCTVRVTLLDREYMFSRLGSRFSGCQVALRTRPPGRRPRLRLEREDNRNVRIPVVWRQPVWVLVRVLVRVPVRVLTDCRQLVGGPMPCEPDYVRDGAASQRPRPQTGGGGCLQRALGDFKSFKILRLSSRGNQHSLFHYNENPEVRGQGSEICRNTRAQRSSSQRRAGSGSSLWGGLRDLEAGYRTRRGRRGEEEEQEEE
ncbi:hypothetical protein EYF80_037561 [Liparis tanakae]|uniref:Uncharacterized protein n=1 Tax=Liparis tanakae TaxID=230148 RepID=A0A4Z2GGD6_9TELE|nr:hypothetical protein EYF80_037561 [Liparis tanakae]